MNGVPPLEKRHVNHPCEMYDIPRESRVDESREKFEPGVIPPALVLCE